MLAWAPTRVLKPKVGSELFGPAGCTVVFCFGRKQYCITHGTCKRDTRQKARSVPNCG